MPVLLAALVVRALVDFGTPLLPKVNGGYYPVQVRALLERGHLAFADFPLVFWIEAGLARLLMALGVASPHAILLSCKAVDTVLPALGALPAFLLARRLTPGSRLLPAAATTTLAVLSLPAVVLTGDCHKNALGLALWFLLALLIHRAAERPSLRRLGAALAVLIALALTHIGAFGVTLTFVLLATGAAGVAALRGDRRVLLLSAAAAGTALGALLAASAWLGDPTRIHRLLTAPLRLLSHPVLGRLLSGRVTPLAGPEWATLVLANGLAGAALVSLLRHRRTTPRATRVVLWAAIGLTMLLASPLISAQYAQRLLLMAHAPAALCAAFWLGQIRPARLRTGGAAALLLLSAASGIASIPPVSQPSISPSAWHELQRLRAAASAGTLARGADPAAQRTRPPSATPASPCQPAPRWGRHTLVVARHGLEWWAAWVLGTHVAQAHRLHPAAWHHYDQVLALRQIRGAAPFGPAGPRGGPPFPEARFPAGAPVLWRGRHFVLARLPPSKRPRNPRPSAPGTPAQ